MNSNKTIRRIVIGAFALMALFAVGGMGLFSSSQVSAQIAQVAPETAGEGVEQGRFSRVHFGRGHKGGKFGGNVDKAQIIADAIGISVEDVEAAFEEGTSLEELAEANGTTVEAVKEAIYNSMVDQINQAVEDGDISQEQADMVLERLELKQLVSQVIDKDALKQVAADTIGVSVEELETAKENRGLSELLEENNVTKEEVKEAMQAAKEEMIDQAVEDGTITAEQGEQLKEGRSCGKFGFGRGRRGGPRQFSPEQAPSINTNA